MRTVKKVLDIQRSERERQLTKEAQWGQQRES